MRFTIPWQLLCLKSISVTSGRLVRLDLSLASLTAAVSGSDVMQLVLKPLSESLGRLVLLIRIGVRDDSVGL